MRKSNIFLFIFLAFAVAQLPAQSARAGVTADNLQQAIDQAEGNIEFSFGQLESLNDPAVDEFLEEIDQIDPFGNPEAALEILQQYTEQAPLGTQTYFLNGLEYTLGELSSYQEQLAAAEQEEFRRMNASLRAAHAARRGVQVRTCRTCGMVREHNRH